MMGKTVNIYVQLDGDVMIAAQSEDNRPRWGWWLSIRLEGRDSYKPHISEKSFATRAEAEADLNNSFELARALLFSEIGKIDGVALDIQRPPEGGV